MHTLARFLLMGPDYQGLITFKRDVTDDTGENKHDEIVITIPFRFRADNPDHIETIFEELSTGTYLPRSEATRGLTKKGESDGDKQV
jgi:hypothetical protein